MAYSIIPADLDKDRELIMSLWDRNFSGVPAGRYDWIYSNNPYGKPISLLLKDDVSATIVGSYSLFPRKIIVNGESIQGYICGDLVVDTQHRALGPAILLIKAALRKSEEEGLILFGFPNALSGPVLLLSGFKSISERAQLTKVLTSDYLVKRYINLPWLPKIISYPLDLFLLLRYGGIHKSLFSKYKYDIGTQFDNRFDLINDKVANSYSLKGEISSDYYNWRFKDSPYEKCNIFTMSLKNNNDLVGYIVFSEKNKKVSILDIATSGNENGEFDSLISSFHRYHKAKNNESITTQMAGDSSFMARLLKNGFSVRSKELKTILYLPTGKKELIGSILSGNWYLTAGDNDI